MIDVREIALVWNGKTILNRITHTFHDGEIVGIIGASGAGKSLFLRAIAGRVPRISGEILVNGQPAPGAAFSLLGNEPPLNRDTPLGHFVLTARLARRRLFSTYSDYDRQVAEEQLAAFGLADRAHTPLMHLTGDELQRAMLAHTFAREASVLLLDDPTAHLALSSVLMLKRALSRSVAGGKRLALVATNDLGFIGQTSDRVVIMDGGSLAEEGGMDLLTPERVMRYFGVAVLISRNVYNGRPEIHLFPES